MMNVAYLERFVISVYRVLFARPCFEGLNRMFFRLGLAGLGVLNAESDEASGEAWFVNKFLPKALSEVREPVVFDVGANEGGYAANILKKFPKARVTAFEPNPATFRRIRERLGGVVVLYNEALGSACGEAELFDYPDSDGSGHASLYPSVLEKLHGGEGRGVLVKVNTLDAVIDACGVERVNLLKVDVEGHELDVLLGGSKAIARGAIDIIQFEFNEMNVISKVFLRDFRELLPGYELWRLLPGGMVRVRVKPVHSEIFGFQNVVAIRRR